MLKKRKAGMNRKNGGEGKWNAFYIPFKVKSCGEPSEIKLNRSVFKNFTIEDDTFFISNTSRGPIKPCGEYNVGALTLWSYAVTNLT